MAIKLLAILAALSLSGCIFRNIELSPARDGLHGIVRSDPVPQKANGMLGSEPIWKPSRAEAMGLKQCSGCHR